MRENIRDILLQAKRGLEALACIIQDDPMNKYNEYLINDKFSSNVLDSLIRDATEVQSNNSLVQNFASKYSLINRSKIMTQSTEAIHTGYTPQPAPIRRTTTPIHDLVIIDLIQPFEGARREDVGLLCKEIDKRKAIGLAEYSTPLQAFNGRDCETDAIEEMVDSICYLKQGILEGKTYLEPIYHRAIALAVDTINLRAINSP